METIFLHAPKNVMKIGKIIFFTSITSDQHSLEEEELDDVSFDFKPPPPKIRCFSEAIHSHEHVKVFLDAKGYSEQATVVYSALDMVASLICSSLTEFHGNNNNYNISVIIVFND